MFLRGTINELRVFDILTSKCI